MSSANFISGSIEEKINSISDYWNLKQKNEEIAYENSKLKSYIINNSKSRGVDIKIDSIIGVDFKDLIVSKIIRNSYNSYKNILLINSGAKEGVMPDMGVINNFGIVGIVNETSTNFSSIISVLNTKSLINAKTKHSSHFGSLKWNGKSTGFVQLEDIPRLATIKKGDTIVTGGQSDIFPENINIGTVYKIYISNETNLYTLDIKLFNDMTNLDYVYVIKRNKKLKEELQYLEKKEKDE